MAGEEIPRTADGRVDTAAYARSQGRTPAKMPPSNSMLEAMDANSLSKRKGKRVGGVKKRNRAAPFDMGAYLMSQQANQQKGMETILNAYSKSQQRSPMVRRDISGNVVDPDKASEGLDWFDTRNPYTEKAQQRKRNVNAENAYQQQMARFEGYNAVQAKKAEQAAMGNQDPNAVMSKTINGQKFVFDKQGNPVGMTGDNRKAPEGSVSQMQEGMINGQSVPFMSTGRLTGSGAELTRNAFIDAMSKADAKPAAVAKPVATASNPMMRLDPVKAQSTAPTQAPTSATPALGQRFDIPNQSATGGSGVGDFLKAAGGMASPGNSTKGRYDIPMQASAGGDASGVSDLFKAAGDMISPVFNTPGNGYTGRRFDVPNQAGMGADASGVGNFLGQIPGMVKQGMNELSERTTMPTQPTLPQLPDMPNMPYQRDREVDPNNPNQYKIKPNWWDQITAALGSSAVPPPNQRPMMLGF